VEEREDQDIPVVDKRAARAAEPEGEQQGGAAQGEGQPGSEGAAGEQPIDERASTGEADGERPEPAEPTNAYALLLWVVGLLYQQAWINLGLMADPATGQVTRDLEQARAIIDCVEFIAKRLEGHVEAQEARELRYSQRLGSAPEGGGRVPR